MIKHITNMHPEFKLYKCSFCDKKYLYVGGLTQHESNIHPEQVLNSSGKNFWISGHKGRNDLFLFSLHKFVIFQFLLSCRTFFTRLLAFHALVLPIHYFTNFQMLCFQIMHSQWQSLKWVKPNYFKKQSSSSSFLVTSGNNTGPKCQWSTQQASSMS